MDFGADFNSIFGIVVAIVAVLVSVYSQVSSGSASDLQKGLDYLQVADELETVEGERGNASAFRTTGLHYVHRAYRRDWLKLISKWYWRGNAAMLGSMVGSYCALAYIEYSEARYQMMLVSVVGALVLAAVLFLQMLRFNRSFELWLFAEGDRETADDIRTRGLSIEEYAFCAFLSGFGTWMLTCACTSVSFLPSLVLVLVVSVWRGCQLANDDPED